MQQLGAEDFHRAASGLLVEWGTQGLTIAAVCERLAVTKGSFYHHFGSLHGFVLSLTASWEAEHAERLAEVARECPDSVERFTVLLDLAAELPHPVELSMRLRGRGDDAVAEAVARVDRRWERQLADPLVALDVDRIQARTIARLVLAVVAGTQLREDPVDPRRLRALLEEINPLADLSQ